MTKIDADLTDFPVLVYLNSSRIDWTHVQDDLDDLTVHRCRRYNTYYMLNWRIIQ